MEKPTGGETRPSRVPPEVSVLCLALFWPLDQLAANAHGVPLAHVPRPVTLVTLAALAVAVLLGRLAGSRVAGCYVASAWVVLFWVAGGLAQPTAGSGGPSWGGGLATGIVLGGGLLLARALGRYTSRDPSSPARLGGLLAITGAIFFVPALGRCLVAYAAAAPPPLEFPGEISTRPVEAVGTPDVYMIVLDAYARADVLEELYATDDAPFRNQLQALGFQVATGARANYVATLHSLVSLLNLDHLPATDHLAARAPRDPRPLAAALRAPRLLRLARERGYRLRYRGTGAKTWYPEPFDEYVDPGPTPLEHLLLSTSAIGALRPGLMHDTRRRRIARAIDTTAISADAPPTWTLLHVLAPHPPFVFAADGGPFRDQAPFLFHIDHEHLLDADMGAGYYRDGFRQQTLHIGDRIGALAEQIVTRRERPAVVWIFGDHGPRALPLDAPREDLCRERSAILHALYTPPGLELDVGPSPTLVGTARALARGLLGADLPALEERVWYHVATNEYRLQSCPSSGSPGAS